MDQNELNLMMGEALNSTMRIIAAQQRQLTLLHNIIGHHQNIFNLLSDLGSQGEEVREITAKAAAEIEALKRLYNLEPGKAAE